MRDLLTGLAVLLILILSAALAGPYVVDWDARRPWFEARIEEAVGLPARIQGPIEVRLLPAPTIRVGDLRIGRSAGPDAHAEQGPVLTIGSAALELAATPLLKGDIRIVEATLADASLALTLGADGRVIGFPPPRPGAAVPAAAIEKLRLAGGSLVIADQASGRTAALLKIEAEAEAGSLAGPWRIVGEALAGGTPIGFRVATGAADAEGLRLRARTETPATQTKSDIEGRLGLSAEGAPVFEGKALLSGLLNWPGKDGPAARPWSAAARLKAAGRAVTLDGIDAQAGPAEAGLKLTGTGTLDLGPEPRLALALETKQFDFDRPLGAPERAPGRPRAILAAWLDALTADGRFQGLGYPVTLSLGTPAALLAGDALSNVALTLSFADGDMAVRSFEAVLPGTSTLSANGRIGLGSGASFAGRVALASRDPARLWGWIEAERSGRSARFGEAREIEFQADLSLASDLVAARNARLAIDKSIVTGALRYSPAEEGRRARFEGQFASDGLSLEQLPDLGFVAGLARDGDIALAVDARHVSVGRGDGPQVAAGRVALKLAADGQDLVLDTLDISDLGGASVKASGRLGDAGGKLDASIDAEHVAPLADMLGRVMPGLPATLLAERARVLGPLKLRLGVERQGSASATRLTLGGVAGGTRITGAARFPAAGWDAGPDSASLQLDAPEAGVLLSQLGLETLALTGLGRGRLDLRLDSAAAGAPKLTLTGDLAGVALKGDGVLAGRTGAPDFEGSLQADSANATPLLRILALPAPDLAARWPAALRAKVKLSDGELRLTDLAATLAQTSLTGTATYEAGKRRLDASLATERLTLTGLASLALGPQGAPGVGSPWSATPFPILAPPPVDIALALTAKTMDLGFGPPANQPTLRARWTKDSLEISEFAAAFAGGRLGAAVTLRRDAAQSALSGKLSLSGAALGQIAPASGLAGTLDLELDGGATGDTPAAFIGNLGGGGRLRVGDIRIPRLDAAALAAVTGLFDARRDPPDPRQLREAMAAGLDKGALSLPELEAPISLTAGQIRVGPIGARTADALGQASGAFDLRTGRMEARLQLLAKSAPKTWTGLAPQIAIEWRSAPSGLTREIDVSSLANALTTRAVMRELERVEAAEMDLRERGFFVRRLRAEREAWDRAIREAEEARLAEEARKKAEEEQRVRAEAEARQKAEAARRAAEDARRRAAEEARLAAEAQARGAGAEVPRLPSASNFFDPRQGPGAPAPAESAPPDLR